MNVEISGHNNYFDGKINGSSSFMVDEPTICPICKHAIKPVRLCVHTYARDTDRTGQVSIMYLCQNCFNPFIASFTMTSMRQTSRNYVAPIKAEERIFNKYIADLSQDFVEIYNQSKAAEAHNLHHIAGIGYRKALEFLVKSFVLAQNIVTEEQVNKMTLMQCINKLPNEASKLKVVAERCAWLGNDQTHFTQIFSDKDTEDMKDLLDATIYWMNYILMADHVEDSMQKGNP